MAVLHAQSNVADRNGDGLLDSREFVVWRGLKGVSATSAEASFELIDSDADGAISWKDFTDAAHQHGLEALLYAPSRTG